LSLTGLVNPACKSAARNMERCEECMRPIKDRSTIAMDKRFHPECFVCTHCKKPFPDGKFIPHKGKPYCRSDFANMCLKCDKVITSGYIEFEQEKYHPACFKCHLCRKSLAESEFFELDGKPYCKSDYELEKRLSSKKDNKKDVLEPAKPEQTKSSSASSVSIVPAPSKRKEEDDPPISSGYGPKCDYCGETVEGRRLNHANKVYHEECFKCSACFSPISPDSEFTFGKFGIVCLKCNSRTCSVCKGVIPPEETPFEKNGNKMHAKCFQCTTCKCVLNPKEAYEFRLKPYCMPHYSAARVMK